MLPRKTSFLLALSCFALVSGFSAGKAHPPSYAHANVKRNIHCLRIVPCNSRTPGCYSVDFRINLNYKKISLKWYELTDFSKKTRKYHNKRLLLETIMKDYRTHPDPEHVFSIEANLQNLARGVYRIYLKGEGGGRNNSTCELIVEYDGTKFTEL